MIPCAHALRKALRRLFLAALQVALVLAWPSSALAEDGQEQPAGEQKVGMCASSAQSIAAPPPIYPSEEAVARPCSPPGEELHHGVPLLPQDAPASVELNAEKSAVLPAAIPFPRRVTQLVPRARALAQPGEEHRARSKRPPRP